MSVHQVHIISTHIDRQEMAVPKLLGLEAGSRLVMNQLRSAWHLQCAGDVCGKDLNSTSVLASEH